MARNAYPAKPLVGFAGVVDLHAEMRGEEPAPKLGAPRAAPGPTHTSPMCFHETAQRRPYREPEQIRSAGLDEGVALRQKIT